MKRIKIKKHLKNLKYLFQLKFPHLWFWSYKNNMKIITQRETKKVLNEYSKFDLNATQLECINYIKTNGRAFRPYFWAKEYMCRPIQVYYDEKKALHYVLHHQKKLYFPSKWAKSDIFKLYNELCVEQDPRSAHCYFDTNFQVDNGSLFIDVGAAEGIIALENIERIGKCYLIECDENWIEALKATFEPYRKKVSIIPKIASDTNTETSITLDQLIADENNVCIKIDVEGYEVQVLNGMKKTLSSPTDAKIKLAVCTYHKWNDLETISNMLIPSFPNQQAVPNYVCMCSDIENGEINEGKMPFLRSAVLRVWN